MKTVAIIGAGRLGTSLGIALKKNGYPIKALSCLRLSSARESSRLIGEGQPYTDNLKAAGTSRIIIITVPDDKIKKSAEKLASGIPDWEEKLVWHCSGLLPSRILDPLKAKGAMTASVHPVQSFAKKNAAPDMFKGDNGAAFSTLKAGVRRCTFGSDCYAYGLLASGYLDIVCEADLKPYDYCALAPVVAGASGTMTDWIGQPLRIDSDGRVLAAGDTATHAQALASLTGSATS